MLQRYTTVLYVMVGPESFQLEDAAAVTAEVGGGRRRYGSSVGYCPSAVDGRRAVTRPRNSAAEQRDRRHGVVGVRLHAGLTTTTSSTSSAECRG